MDCIGVFYSENGHVYLSRIVPSKDEAREYAVAFAEGMSGYEVFIAPCRVSLTKGRKAWKEVIGEY